MRANSLGLVATKWICAALLGQLAAAHAAAQTMGLDFPGNAAVRSITDIQSEINAPS